MHSIMYSSSVVFRGYLIREVAYTKSGDQAFLFMLARSSHFVLADDSLAILADLGSMIATYFSFVAVDFIAWPGCYM